ncbi:transmembrane protein, putative (macronuclear) [Tetrahymena thermophila SB210]|uniref:Transmembrane protein, putative n=1 Tax=Tetrahymena thermophila (strain SB210) TaxID=312017 RepID=Q228B5_TETTS|nr:transmembrane protein, putative [Tetrahymena thermophila SB210]EAR81632.3 transmembrane protein, putative [Tetrahymena thermophila SB210]|eukprot:XP_001029295.3 transmembrane protein, putative [Tetrahymena thermophila SB210]
MSKDKNYSFIRYFDIFAPPYYQKISQDHYKKKTVIGGIFSILYVSVSLGYFLYLMIYFYQGKIAPKFTQFDEVQDEGVDYEINAQDIFISIYQDQETNLLDIEQQNKVQYFDIFLQNRDRQINSFTYDGCLRFGESGDILLSLKSDPMPLYGNNIQITVKKCSGNFLRDSSYRCASQQEVDELLQQDLPLILYFKGSNFSIKNNELKPRIFLTYSTISKNFLPLIQINAKMQNIDVQRGLLFQSTQNYQQIIDFNQIVAQSSINPGADEVYNDILITLNNVVTQTQVQYPLLSEVFAYVWGIASMLLLTGYVFKSIAQATLAQDFLGIQLKYYYKKTAIRLFGQSDNEKLNNSVIESKQSAEVVLKQNEVIQNVSFKKNLRNYFKISNFQKWKVFFLPSFCQKRRKKSTTNQKLLDILIKQTNKDMCVFEMQKEFLKLRTAIKLLLTPEQYSAIQMCGCDLINEEQLISMQLRQEQEQKDDQNDNQEKDINDKELYLDISDIQEPLNKPQPDHSILQISNQKKLNHLELMNQVDTDRLYRQECLQRFLTDNQQNYSSDQQSVNQRIVNCIIGYQSIPSNRNKQNEEAANIFSINQNDIQLKNNISQKDN